MTHLLLDPISLKSTMTPGNSQGTFTNKPKCSLLGTGHETFPGRLSTVKLAPSDDMQYPKFSDSLLILVQATFLDTKL